MGEVKKAVELNHLAGAAEGKKKREKVLRIPQIKTPCTEKPMTP